MRFDVYDPARSCSSLAAFCGRHASVEATRGLDAESEMVGEMMAEQERRMMREDLRCERMKEVGEGVREEE